MFDLPAHHTQIIMKPFIGRATRTGQPGTYRRLLIKARGVGLDAKERNQIFIAFYTKFACGLERLPQPRCERRIVDKLRIVLAQIHAHTVHKPLRIDIGERRNLFRRQLKHADVSSSVLR